MVVKEVNVLIQKIPRGKPLVDRPIEFPPLQNLHLDMMENKLKLKKSVPRHLIQKKVVPPPVIQKTPPPDIEKVKEKIKDKENRRPALSADDEDEEDELLGELMDDSDDDDVGGASPSTPRTKAATPGGAVSGAVGAAATVAAVAEAVIEPEDPDANLSPEEREAKEKEEYLWKFKLLKKGNPGKTNIPSYNEHDDLTQIKLSYDRTIKEVLLDRNVSSYKGYLVGAWLGIEYLAINFMDIDLEGFAQEQMLIMDEYNTLLVELGERSYNRWGMNLPVEIKLLGMIIFQAGLFYMLKNVGDKKGQGTADLVRVMTGAPIRKSTSTVEEVKEQGPSGSVPGKEAQKKKMRGPSVTASDIKKMGGAKKTKEEDSSDDDSD